MKKFWNWLRDPDNRGALTLIGGFFASLVVAAWAWYVHEKPFRSDQRIELGPSAMRPGSLPPGDGSTEAAQGAPPALQTPLSHARSELVALGTINALEWRVVLSAPQSWKDASERVATLDREIGKGYRLPTGREIISASNRLKGNAELLQLPRTYWTSEEGTFVHLDRASSERAFGIESVHNVIVVRDIN